MLAFEPKASPFCAVEHEANDFARAVRLARSLQPGFQNANSLADVSKD